MNKNKKFLPETVEKLYREELQSFEDSINDVQPFFEDKNLICLSSSDYYSKYASVVLTSLISNSNSAKNYEIAVLTNDMSIYNQHILLSLVENLPNFKLRIFNIKEKIQNIEFYTWAHFTANTYFRLLIPELFKNYNKVLYLDSDIVINTDINNIFDYEMGDNYIAAVKDTHVYSFCMGLHIEQLVYNRDILKLEKPFDYYQMGVAVYNIKQILKDYNSDFLIDLAGKVKYKWLDQDILNKTFQGRYKELPIKWNVMIANNFPDCDEYYLPDNMRKEYVEARLNPNIIHYCGGVCFQHPFFPDMGHYFFKYARLSPYYEEILFEKCKATMDFKEFDKHIYQAIMLMKKRRINYIQYLKYKFLRFFIFGKKRRYYFQMENFYKEKLEITKNISRYE